MFLLLVFLLLSLFLLPSPSSLPIFSPSPIPSPTFQKSEFSLYLLNLQGQTQANISFQVRPDSKPEPDEIFIITLSNITTYEIAASGAAELIPDKISATLSVRASDEPHGVVEFQSGSRLFSTEEANKTITLVVTRLYGTIGKW